MSFDASAPYGEVVESTVRVATWNTWARFGAWEERQAGIEAELAAAAPDLVFLTEAWIDGDDSQAARVAAACGLTHVADTGDQAVATGIGIASRWPITSMEQQPLLGGTDKGIPGIAVMAVIDGPRGPLQTFTVMLDYPLDASARRQAQARELCAFIQENSSRRWPTILCGDFNANPDSDEIRMLTGKSTTAVEGLVFYDSWEVAGDGSPGFTWSNENPLAALSLYPNRRFDYVLSAWPRAGGIGHPVACELLGVRASDEPQLSDHYGVIADLRY